MSDEKKIIVDEDWKTRVAAEKEALRVNREPAHRPATVADDPAAAAGPASMMRGPCLRRRSRCWSRRWPPRR